MGKSPEFTRREFGKISLLALTSLGLRSCGIEPFENIAAPEDKNNLNSPAKLSNPLSWGIYTGQGIKDIEKVESTVGLRTDFLTEFVAWEDEGLIPDEALEYAKNSNKKIITFWEAYTPGKDADKDSKYSCKNIGDGKFDKYLKEFADSLRDKPNEVIIFPFPEPNGDWTPQSLTINDNRGKFIDAYRHVSTFFTNLPNIKMGLALNNQPVPVQDGNTFDNYFPGKRWVNLIGIDGFNFGPPTEEWQSFSDIFSPALETINRWDLDILISSFGCAPGDNRVTWFKDAFEVMKSNKYRIVGANIFAENREEVGSYERDWSLDEITLRSLSDFLK